MRQRETGPTRVSITGIDGAGKDTIAKLSLSHVAQMCDVAKLGRPSYLFRQGESEPSQIFRRTTGGFDRLHQIADRVRDKKLIVAANALNVIAQTRILEPAVERKHPGLDLIASSRDPRVDPTVYARYYMPSASEQFDAKKRLETMQRITNVDRDLIIYLDIDPELATERIRLRMEAETEEHRRSTGKTSLREKWQHMHENVSDLTRLADGYQEAFSALQEVRPAQIVEIDTTSRTKDEVAYLASSAILNAMQMDVPSLSPDLPRNHPIYT